MSSADLSCKLWKPILQTIWTICQNILDPDQDRQKIGPDLDPNRFDTDSVPERIFWKSKFWKKSADDNKSMKNYPACILIQDSPIHKFLFWVAISVLQLDEVSLYSAGLSLLEQNLHTLDNTGLLELDVSTARFAKAWKVLEYWGLSWKFLENLIWLEKYLNIGIFLKSPWNLNLPRKVLENHSKALKSPLILLFSVKLKTVIET